jgi:8-oxo-dGTP diphosphatase
MQIRAMPKPVLAAVILRNDLYLVCQRPSHKRHGGLWEFPGGKLEPGEDYFQAAQRELGEELGVRVMEVGELTFSVEDPGSEFRIDFVPTSIQGEPQCIEHPALQWLALHDLPALDLAPSDRRFVEFLVAQETADASSLRSSE